MRSAAGTLKRRQNQRNVRKLDVFIISRENGFQWRAFFIKVWGSFWEVILDVISGGFCGTSFTTCWILEGSILINNVNPI